MTNNVSDITAQNPALNSTLDRAHQIQSQLAMERISVNPRIYADKFIFGGYMVPELANQNNSDLVGWATQNYDGSDSLAGRGLPPDLPVYLVIFVSEGGNDNFCDVASIDAEMKNEGKTLRQAVGL